MLRKNSQIAYIFFLSAFGLTLCGCQTTPNAGQNSDQAKVTEGAAAAGENTARANANSNQTSSLAANKNGSEPVSTQLIDKTQSEQVIDRYIKGVAKVSDAAEYEEARKIIYGDLDGDGDEDAAAQFTIEGMGGGNNYGFWLAVFKNDNGKFTGITDEVIGGKMNRNVSLTKIEDGKIHLDTTEYDKDDGACCPSIEGKTSYILQGNKLVEKKLK